MHPQMKHIMRICSERNKDINQIISFSHWTTSALYLIGFLKYKNKSKEFICLRLEKLYKWRMGKECPDGFVKECMELYYDRIWFNSSFYGQILKVI